MATTKQKVQHTPGPWRRMVTRIEAEVEGRFRLVGKANTFDSFEEAEANARLMEAAPDFYAACVEYAPEDGDPGLYRLDWLAILVSTARDHRDTLAGDDPDAFWECLMECQRMHDGLKAAIAKAEGR